MTPLGVVEAEKPHSGGTEPQLVWVHVMGNKAVFAVPRTGAQSPATEGSATEQVGQTWGSGQSGQQAGLADGQRQLAPQAPCGGLQRLQARRC